MAIRAIVFDVGGVLELTTEPTFMQRWETNLGLEPGSLSDGLGQMWEAGSIGAISLDEVHRGIAERELRFDHLFARGRSVQTRLADLRAHLRTAQRNSN